MTYCLALKVDEGLVALADGRVTSGSQFSTASKISLHAAGGAQFFVMTSGLRSLRDKTVTYLERALREGAGDGASDGGGACTSLLDAVDAYTKALRRTAEEDQAALRESELDFNLHALIGGQLRDDPEPLVLLVYPEGNWIAIDRRTPYLSVGATSYGKPILDRALQHDTAMRTALKLAFLSFDSTRFSSADVGYPIDLLTYTTAERQWRQTHYEQGDLNAEADWWSEHLTGLATQMPDGPWVDTLLPPRLRAVGDT